MQHVELDVPTVGEDREGMTSQYAAQLHKSIHFASLIEAHSYLYSYLSNRDKWRKFSSRKDAFSSRLHRSRCSSQVLVAELVLICLHYLFEFFRFIHMKSSKLYRTERSQQLGNQVLILSAPLGKIIAGSRLLRRIRRWCYKHWELLKIIVMDLETSMQSRHRFRTTRIGMKIL